MFKKTKYTLICLLAIMLTVLAFTACKSEHTPSDEPDDPSSSIQRPEENDPDHVHTTGDVVVEDKVEATCKSEGSYYEVLYCTECNKAISKKKVTTDKLSQHTYANGTCTVCGETQKFSEGLAYEEVLGKCIVTGIGTCKDTDIVIPEEYNGKPVVGIGKEAFKENESIKSITISKKISSIGSGAFYNCTELIGIYIEDLAAWCNISFTDYSSNPLRYAKNLYLNGELITELVIPDDVTSICSYAFSGCNKLTSVEISNSVTSIGSYAFYECTKLTSIDIPSSVTGIGNSAFNSCDGLTSIMIPDSVTSIGNYAFDYCYRLVEVINKSSLDISVGSSYGSIAEYVKIVHTGDTLIKNVDDYLFITVDGVNYLVSYVGEDTELVLPDNYNGESYVINDYAFYDCAGLTSVIIPDSVTSIGEDAFRSCDGLTSVVIGNSVTSIGNSAFDWCDNLTAVGYTGTEEEWKKIGIGYSNYSLTSATIIYNYTE